MGGILARLKIETQSEHRAIESVLDLAGGGLTRPRYRWLLARFLGFYRPVEDALRELGGWHEYGLDLADRWKVPLLELDLRALGDTDTARTEICREIPALTTLAAGFGSLYVLEGATLGGQIISKHILGTLGIAPECGGRFFHGYGDQTGARWRDFGAALARFSSDFEVDDEVVSVAIQTFRSLRKWCESEPAVASDPRLRPAPPPRGGSHEFAQ